MTAIPIRGGGNRWHLGEIVAWAQVDEDDYADLIGYRWTLHGDGYACRSTHLNGIKRTVMMHRQLLGLGHEDPRQGDHINGDRLDNRRSNLRLANFKINGKNKRSFSGSSSKYRGVSWFKDRKKWGAYITCDGERHHLGFFTDELEAAEAARRARLQMMPEAVS